MPEVSVIIPTYNSARYMTAAVDSVLAQTFTDYEILVIDDGSTDETEAVMGRYGPPVLLLPQRNGGVSVARNRGLEASRGRYVAFLDADDTWLPNKLERQLAELGKHPEAPRLLFGLHRGRFPARSARHPAEQAPGAGPGRSPPAGECHRQHLHRALRALALRDGGGVRPRPQPVRRLGHVGPPGQPHRIPLRG